MWFLIIIFMVIGGFGVLLRSTKTLLVLAMVFSFIAMLYTPWWPIVGLMFVGMASILYLNRRDETTADRKHYEESVRQNLKDEVQSEVEIGSLLKNMEKYENRAR